MSTGQILLFLTQLLIITQLLLTHSWIPPCSLQLTSLSCHNPPTPPNTTHIHTHTHHCTDWPPNCPSNLPLFLTVTHVKFTVHTVRGNEPSRPVTLLPHIKCSCVHFLSVLVDTIVKHWLWSELYITEHLCSPSCPNLIGLTEKCFYGCKFKRNSFIT